MAKKINTVILDDDEKSITDLKEQLKFYDYINIVGSFNNFSDLWHNLSENHDNVNLIFLDIILIHESGIEIANLIAKNYPNIKIIFCTSDPSFALDAYESQPVNYLTKPINAVRLQNTLTKLKNIIVQKKPTDYNNVKIGIKSKNQINMIDIHHILLIKKNFRNVKIILKDKSNFITSEGLKDLYFKLRKFGFVMINRSTIIPIKEISSINYNQSKQNYELELISGIKISGISKSRLKEVKTDLAEFNWII